MTKLQRQIERILLDDLLNTQEQCAKIEKLVGEIRDMEITKVEMNALWYIVNHTEESVYIGKSVQDRIDILKELLKRIYK